MHLFILQPYANNIILQKSNYLCMNFGGILDSSMKTVWMGCPQMPVCSQCTVCCTAELVEISYFLCTLLPDLGQH